MSEAEFDPYASRYQDLHAASIGASGEEPEYFAAYKCRLVAQALGTQSQQPISFLDFGSGVGGNIPLLSRELPSAAITGVDVSEESIRIARVNCGSAARFFVIQDTLSPPLTVEQDAAMAACVFHHIPPPARKHWVDEVFRNCRKGANFFIFEHNPWNPLTRHVVNNCEFDANAILLTAKEAASLCRRAGFSRVETRYIVFFPKFLSGLRFLEPRLGWLPLGAQYVIHAVK